MDLINDLGVDLALAFLVEKRFREKIDSKDAANLICRIRSVLEATPFDHPIGAAGSDHEQGRSVVAH